VHREKARRLLNEHSKNRIPFFFVSDFAGEKFLIQTNSEEQQIQFAFPERPLFNLSGTNEVVQFAPLDRENYFARVHQVQTAAREGHTYLLNLCERIPVLKSPHPDILFSAALAPYKVYYRGHFLFFSPEPFVKIVHGKICTFPMKGTLKIVDPFECGLLLSDPKEMAEHATIVDLLRNDLSQVAHSVRVEKYRYTEIIKRGDSSLCATSSRICGLLKDTVYGHLGDILVSMLPAGSVTGAPKKRTVELIQSIEQTSRGFYTGVSGYFDGEKFDSAVNIRFIEIDGDRLYFRAGGGITIYSDPEKEYNEIVAKTTIPFA